MADSERKRRAFREREALFLDTARQILLDRGYLGLTMDRIAEATEYSKGTVYLHFANKEEVLAGLAQRLVETKLDLFQRASTLAGRPRERCLAIGVGSALWAALYPEDIRLTQIVHSESLREKLGTDRREGLEDAEEACLSTLVCVVEEAIQIGDLALEAGMSAGQIAHGLWALHWGAQTLEQLDLRLDRLDADGRPELLMRHCHALLDGYGWLPTFRDHDWSATEQRVGAELFDAEFARLSELSTSH
ncbi:MAG: TetR/AcrR family transcriptional regulator [Planctomycetota bacterium]|jgi:AcrR family transcriptional regulator